MVLLKEKLAGKEQYRTRGRRAVSIMKTVGGGIILSDDSRSRVRLLK